ncbi:MAG: bifunctional UDP-sugar hydrolase/5'-nucleotidase [Myxococcota bacterium]|nr:bifunctional UDP-sugar hydrolase/5'-nucleotidase [Myxococcota bacterium]
MGQVARVLPLFALVACVTGNAPQTPTGPPVATPPPAQQGSQRTNPVALDAQKEAESEARDERTIRIFHTSDEHGWFQGYYSKSHGVRYGGAEVLRRHLKDWAYDDNKDLLLSGGDSWTGPAESPLLGGESMVKVFNYIGYDAVAVGNHEFDFGLDQLRKNVEASQFPYLAGNVTWPPTLVALPFQPRVVFNRKGRKIAVIGFTYEATGEVTHPGRVGMLEFKGYNELAIEQAKTAQAEGADASVIILHDNPAKLAPLASQLKALGVRAVLGGHVHEPFEMMVDGVAFCVPFDRMRETCRVDLDRETLEAKVERRPLGSRDNDVKDKTLAKIMDSARSQAEAKTREVLAEAEAPLSKPRGIKQPVVGQLIGVAWLEAVEGVHAAVTNRGGVRMGIQQGPVQLGHIIGVMPFDNQLVRVELTRDQLHEVLSHPQSVATGAELKNGKVILRGGLMGPKDKAAVLINDFMLNGGDGYRFQSYGMQADELGIPWRKPVYDYLRRLTKAGEKLSPWSVKKAWNGVTRSR